VAREDYRGTERLQGGYSGNRIGEGVDRGDADGPGVVRCIGERSERNFSAPEVVIARPENVGVLAPFEVRLKGSGG